MFITQTSKKFLRDIGDYRFVWLRTLQDMIERERLLPNSLPLETMTTQDIRLCVTRPLRMRSAVFKDQHPLLSSQSFTLNHGHDMTGNGCVRLLPGGRWIITSAFDGNFSYVSCWDLHHIRKDNELRPVAQTKAKYGGTLMPICLQYDAETRGVVVLLETIHRYDLFQLLYTQRAYHVLTL